MTKRELKTYNHNYYLKLKCENPNYGSDKYRKQLANNPDLPKQLYRKQIARDPECYKRRHRRRIAKDPEYSKKFYRGRLAENPDYYKKYRESNRRAQKIYFNKRRQEDASFRISKCISQHIWRSIKENKVGRHWENLVGYTLEQLKEHLESLFLLGMTWNNHGKWHIDHIIPISLWKFKTAEDREFKQCWARCNLQPLWAKDNIIKSNKII